MSPPPAGRPDRVRDRDARRIVAHQVEYRWRSDTDFSPLAGARDIDSVPYGVGPQLANRVRPPRVPIGGGPDHSVWFRTYPLPGAPPPLPGGAPPDRVAVVLNRRLLPGPPDVDVHSDRDNPRNRQVTRVLIGLAPDEERGMWARWAALDLLLHGDDSLLVPPLGAVPADGDLPSYTGAERDRAERDVQAIIAGAQHPDAQTRRLIVHAMALLLRDPGARLSIRHPAVSAADGRCPPWQGTVLSALFMTLVTLFDALRSDPAYAGVPMWDGSFSSYENDDGTSPQDLPQIIFEFPGNRAGQSDYPPEHLPVTSDDAHPAAETDLASSAAQALLNEFLTRSPQEYVGWLRDLVKRHRCLPDIVQVLAGPRRTPPSLSPSVAEPPAPIAGGAPAASPLRTPEPGPPRGPEPDVSDPRREAEMQELRERLDGISGKLTRVHDEVAALRVSASVGGSQRLDRLAACADRWRRAVFILCLLQQVLVVILLLWVWFR